MKITVASLRAIIIGCTLLGIAGSGIYFGAARYIESIAGRSYSDNHHDRLELQEIASEYDDLIQALSLHEESEGRFPSELSELTKSINRLSGQSPVYTMSGRTVYYDAEQYGYTLYIKLSWDGGLNYESRAGQWRYDPGNGDPDWPINPTTTN